MGNRYCVFDLESDGLELKNITTIHTISIFDSKDGNIHTYDLDEVPSAIDHLEKADKVIGHNIINYDIPVIKKFFPSFEPSKVIDTLVLSRLVYPNLYKIDTKLVNKGDMPKSLKGRYALEAFGYRLGIYKGDFGEETDWEEWSQEMSDYCRQDVKVTVALYKKLRSKEYPKEPIKLEHNVAKIIQRQIENGVSLDIEKAEELYAELSAEAQEIKQDLIDTFGTWVEPKGDVKTAKRDNSRWGYVEGASYQKIKYVTFNPNSRQHIYKNLMDKYDWEPTVWTDGGQPSVTEDVLEELSFPEAEKLSRYLMISKRMGQLYDGKNGWLKLIDYDEGRLHGYVNTNGTITARMTHSSPNLGQVPANDSPYGEECRSLFKPREGWKLVGVDASGLELRCLAHYVGKYDGGDYGEEVINGDIHTKHQEKAGLPTRPKAKRFGYAFLYGAGNELLGDIVADEGASTKEKRRVGKELRTKFLNGIPALKKLQNKVKRTARKRGYLIGLDGRHLEVRAIYRALNTLLQSAGALVMKKALVIADRDLQAKGYVPNEDYEYVLNIHDEIQTECRPELTEEVGETIVEAIRKAGEYFDFRCPLDGDIDIGDSWAETH